MSIKLLAVLILSGYILIVSGHSNGIDRFIQSGASSGAHFLIKLGRADSPDGSSSSYIAPVRLGSKGRIFKIKFDLGTNNFWVPEYHSSWNIFRDDNLNYGDGYNPSESNSSACCCEESQFCYRKSLFKGIQCEDGLTISTDLADQRSPQLEIRQKFMTISHVSDSQFKSEAYDGLIGLGPSETSESGTQNILVAVRDELLKQDPELELFLLAGLWVGRNADAELSLLGIDHSRIAEPVQNHELSSNNDPRRWQIDMRFVKLGEQIISCEFGCYAVFDNTVASLLAPLEGIESIIEILGANYLDDRWAVDCDGIDSLPYLSFVIDGHPYKLSAQHYTNQVDRGDLRVCYLAIEAWAEPGWVLGSGFMQAYYTIYDIDQQQVGIATLRI